MGGKNVFPVAEKDSIQNKKAVETGYQCIQ